MHMIVMPYLGHCVLIVRTLIPTTKPPVCGPLYSDPLCTVWFLCIPESYSLHSILPQVYSHEHLRAFELARICNTIMCIGDQVTMPYSDRRSCITRRIVLVIVGHVNEKYDADG